MSRLRTLTLLTLAFLVTGLSGSLSAAAAPEGGAAAQPGQPGEGERGGRRGRGGDRGDFNPEEFRQRMMERFKEQMGASDDEWKVLQPKLEKVMEAQRDARAGGGGMFGGRGGFGGRRGQDGGGGGDQPQSPVAKASADLRKVVEANSPPEEIAKNLTALREARKQARAALETAQKDLQGVVTPKQEAMLVMVGMLE
jgi:Spy/CpxP family protein refolding chaperone